MKAFFTKQLLALLILFSFLTSAKAQNYTYVIVSGYVKNVNGVAIANKPVNIKTDSTIAAGAICYINKTVNTNPNGYYSDTIKCLVTTIPLVYTSITNCNGVILKNTTTPVQTTTPNVFRVESNFIICVSPGTPTNCLSKFNFTISGNVIHFNSNQSAGTSATDSIIKRDWSFGDSSNSYLTGNIKEPSHTYSNPGTYMVCLKITTASGCVNTYCVSIVIPPVNNNTCKAKFNFTVQGKTAAFNNTSTSGGANTFISSSYWRFGVTPNGTFLGSSTLGNPTFTFPSNGTYKVCLKITTTSGCLNDTCINVTINDTTPPPPIIPCKAKFNVTAIQGKTASFNSTSVSGSGNITSYLWKFGATTAGGAIATSTLQNPTFTFSANGTYVVCLKITTSNGCVSDTCKTVIIHDTITPPVFTCKANFVSSPLPTTQAAGFYIKFNSANSYTNAGDSIISRLWSFGDSASSTNYLSGNIIEPAHFYAKAGVYNVCLKITTAKGCVNISCLNIYVGFNSNPSNCTSFFTIQKVGHKEMKYNSGLSFAGNNDSIVSRLWTFGDGTGLSGNIISPAKKYNHGGTYSVCLKITTAKGCINNFCLPVKVVDSVTSIVTTNGIKIISLYPNPTFGNIYLNVRSFVIGNINAQIEVFDVYNNRKILKTVTLANGNNFIQINSSTLPQGVYLIKITSNNGMDATRFIKL